MKKTAKANKELQENLNIANNNVATLESRSKWLEKQVEDLIETCGQSQQYEGPKKKVSFEPTLNAKKFQNQVYE